PTLLTRFSLAIWSDRAASVDWSLNLLAATQSDATLSEELLSFARKFVISRWLLIRSRDKSFNNKLIKNVLFACTKIPAPSLQNVAKDRNFFVSDKSVCH